MFYRVLRERYGLRSHVAKQAYKSSRSLVVSVLEQFREEFYRESLEWLLDLFDKEDRKKIAKEAVRVADEMTRIVYQRLVRNPAERARLLSKPRLRRNSVRLDVYDASVDLEKMEVTVAITDRRYRIRLLHRRSYVAKFAGRKWYEVILKMDSRGRIWVSIPFRFDYKPYKPRRVLAVDVNLDMLTVYDGARVRRLRTRFKEALRLKKEAERVQARHGYAWSRGSPKWRRIVTCLHRRSSRIVVDWCSKTAKLLVAKAKRMGAAVALEDLSWLWHEKSQKSSNLAIKLSRFAYRKLQQAIITKAIEYDVPVVIVDPRGTSKTCPRCRAPLSYTRRLALCPRCGLARDRDTIGAMNIYLRATAVHAPTLWVVGAPLGDG